MDVVNSLKIFTNSAIEGALSYDDLIRDLQEAFGKFSQRDGESGINQPVRSVVMIPEHQGFFGSMPVYSRYNNILATKLVSFYPQNKELPTHNAVILVFNSNNGKPEAILDGEVITARRTAAASAVASKLLANEDPQILALVGAGVQAKSHFAALSHLFKFKQVKIWNHRKPGAEKLAEELGDTAIACDSVEEAVRDADIIVTATSSPTPVLKAEWVKKGAHINAVGACRPDWAEVEGDLMRSSVVYVDSRDAAVKESGDVILSKAEIFAEIGEVVNGQKEGWRTETTVFKSLGMAIEDAVAAKIVLDNSK